MTYLLPVSCSNQAKTTLRSPLHYYHSFASPSSTRFKVSALPSISRLSKRGGEAVRPLVATRKDMNTSHAFMPKSSAIDRIPASHSSCVHGSDRLSSSLRIRCSTSLACSGVPFLGTSRLAL